MFKTLQIVPTATFKLVGLCPVSWKKRGVAPPRREKGESLWAWRKGRK